MKETPSSSSSCCCCKKQQQDNSTNHVILWQSPPKMKNENQDLWVSAFRNAKCNASYLFWESPCHYLTFIWHFFRNVNEM